MPFAMTFVFTRAARHDLFAITGYYARVSEVVAGRFVDELMAALRTVCALPGIGSPKYAHIAADRSVRCWQLDHFPFHLFYRPIDEVLSILRLLHERRDFNHDCLDGMGN